jgi:hypothetical protein
MLTYLLIYTWAYIMTLSVCDYSNAEYKYAELSSE